MTAGHTENKNYTNLTIESLDTRHDRSGFSCGIPSLDSYLKRQARQDLKRRISRTFVAVEPANPGTVVGYYTLSTLSIELTELPDRLAQKLPRHPIPAALLGRLAVNQIAQGYGVGKMLLVDALKRTLAVGEEIAIYAMVVDAINEQAEHFYRQFGFDQLSSRAHRLFLPLKSLPGPTAPHSGE